MSKRAGIPSERSTPINGEWKSVQLPCLESQAHSASPRPQPEPVLS